MQSLTRSMSISAAAVLSALLLSACSSGGTSSSGGSIPQTCFPGQVQLASPAPGSSGVSTNIGNIVIVANGTNNALYNSWQSWSLSLVDQNGNVYYGSNLTQTPNNGYPKPYGSDFYYSSSLQGQSLMPGSSYIVELNNTVQQCSYQVQGGFST